MYKTELIEHERTTSWSGAAEVERETASYVHWYNESRIHLSIGRMSPARYETLWAASRPAQSA